MFGQCAQVLRYWGLIMIVQQSEFNTTYSLGASGIICMVGHMSIVIGPAYKAEQILNCLKIYFLPQNLYSIFLNMALSPVSALWAITAGRILGMLGLQFYLVITTYMSNDILINKDSFSKHPNSKNYLKNF